MDSLRRMVKLRLVSGPQEHIHFSKPRRRRTPPKQPESLCGVTPQVLKKGVPLPGLSLIHI